MKAKTAKCSVLPYGCAMYCGVCGIVVCYHATAGTSEFARPGCLRRWLLAAQGAGIDLEPHLIARGEKVQQIMS